MYKSVPFLEMPDIAIGTGGPHFKHFEGNFHGNVKDEAVTQILESLTVGFRHIDTAELYGTDRELSVALDRFYSITGYQREDLWITSKLYDNLADPISSCKAIIQRIGCNYLDLLLLHVPLRFIHYRDKIPLSNYTGGKTLGEVWSAMENLVELGLVRHIGVSNYEIADLQELFSLRFMTIPPFVNQVERHIYLQQRDLKAYCSHLGVRLVSYGVLSPLKRFRRGPVDDVIDYLSTAYSELLNMPISPSVILIRHAQQSDFIPVISTSSLERMKEYLPALADSHGQIHRLLNLSPADLAKIDETGKYRHQRYYGGQDYPNETTTIPIYLDGQTYFFGAALGHAENELKALCDSFHVTITLESCDQIRNYYMKIVQQVNLQAPKVNSIESSFSNDGFMVVPNLLSPEKCTEIQQTVMQYVESKGPLLRRYDSRVPFGYYIADIKTDKQLKYIFHTMHASTRLHEALSSIFGGSSSYHFLQRNELNINREVGFHRDRVEEIFYPIRPSLDDWSHVSLRENSDYYSIVNVAVYLQDHDIDGRGLTVEVGSHKCPDCRGPTVKIASKMCDAIIFDNRILHSGATLYNISQNRVLLSIGYGKNNIFSEEFRIALSHRNFLFNNLSICAGDAHADVPCVEAYMKPRYLHRISSHY
jgi:alcohol dehydrogenase (NADP+)